jgi:hypothetical protein
MFIGDMIISYKHEVSLVRLLTRLQ